MLLLPMLGYLRFVIQNKYRTKMTYHPTLSDKTKEKLDETKEMIKNQESEEEEERGDWRNGNNTLNADKIIRRALMNFNEDDVV